MRAVPACQRVTLVHLCLRSLKKSDKTTFLFPSEYCVGLLVPLIKLESDVSKARTSTNEELAFLVRYLFLALSLSDLVSRRALR